MHVNEELVMVQLRGSFINHVISIEVCPMKSGSRSTMMRYGIVSHAACYGTDLVLELNLYDVVSYKELASIM